MTQVKRIALALVVSAAAIFGMATTPSADAQPAYGCIGPGGQYYSEGSYLCYRGHLMLCQSSYWHYQGFGC